MQQLVRLAAFALALQPFGTHAADLVVWWEKGFYEQEDESVREIVAAFEDETGAQVELVRPPQREIDAQAQAALEAGRPPDFLFMSIGALSQARWAHGGHLVDLEDIIGLNLDLFDEDAIEQASWVEGTRGERSLYALPMGRLSNHLHAWSGLLEQAGFTLADIPDEWEAFWSFWCDEVQPAVREATGRSDLWAIGLPMSVEAATDTLYTLAQFQLAHEALWIDREGRLQVDDPAVREGLVKALDGYIALWRKGCTPPDAVDWTNVDNNQAFLERRVVMTPNTTLSIPGALRRSRPDDYYDDAVTIEWPDAVDGDPLPIAGATVRAVVFENGTNQPLAEDFVRFLVEDGWLAHWLSFAGDRYMPPMRKLVDQPFWLDPGDPHRMRAAMQILERPHRDVTMIRGREPQSNQIRQEAVWGKAVERVVVDGLTPEHAVDEAIARIKEILGE